ncbi:hypothetical protein QR680_017791 [Steinernema hermaphroditum]|uniref:Uncharacterized protein n=1 Tax=Steinernema hermaphroditum TaxID=289476 RepID=A0AA39HFU3_9BILA|nr:hypothetical protein QR680_017791 [Steinernema hermaphroditum]
MTHSPTARVLLEKNFVFRERQRFLKHSNSTSRLILPRHRQQTPTPVVVTHPSGVVASSSTQHFAQPSRTLAESGKRFASTEGRFTIIDERNKGPDSDESSSEASDDEPIMMAPPRVVVPPSTPKCPSTPVNSPPNAVDKKAPVCKMPTSNSRFKIVPVESHYKRGRWHCHDFYDEGSKKVATEANGVKPVTLTPSNKNAVTPMSSTLAAPSRLNSSANAPPTPQRQPVTFAFDLSDNESDRENSTPTNFARSHSPPAPPLSPRFQTATLNVAAAEKKKSSESGNPPPPPTVTPVVTPAPTPINTPMTTARTPRPNLLGTHTASDIGSISSINGRISPSDLISNYGLERSLSVASYTDKSILDLLPGTVPPAGTPFAGQSDERLARHSETEASSAASDNNGMQCVPQVHHLSDMFHNVWWGDDAKKHARAPSLDYDVEVASDTR